MPEPLAGLAGLLQSPLNIVVTTHLRPDGDAMGSTLGLQAALQQRGHSVQVLLPTECPTYLNWMPGAKQALVGETQLLACQAAITQADLIFCLDYGTLSRAGVLESSLAQATAPKVNVDHHLDALPFATYEYREVKASSTCELIYKLLVALYDKPALTSSAATCLYTGIMTDTGSFRFDSVTPAVHRTVADLIEAGAQVGQIHHLVFNNYSAQRTHFLGYCLAERLTVLPAVHTAYITVPNQAMQHYGISSGDTEGIVNYALGIQGVNFGAILIEYPDEVKMSFRSIGSFSASAFAGHFAGGGHYNAAGGRSTLSLQATEANFLNLLYQQQAQLNYSLFVH